MLRRHLIALIVFPLSFFAGSVLRAEDQTTTFSPVTRWNRDYSIQLTPYSMNDANVPGLQSFVAGAHQDEWVILAGKTGGQHDFETGNRTAWVVNPVTQQAWGRTLDDPMSGLSTHTVNSLSSTNAQSYQTGQTLFITGGYVYDSHADNFTTYKELTAVDLPDLIHWVKTPGTSLPNNTILQTEGPEGDMTNYEGGFFQVTGGGMFELDGTTHLIFGQLFKGPYSGNNNHQKYSSQIRSFEIDYDHGAGSLAFSNTVVDPIGGDPSQFQRRDLNTFPVLSKNQVTQEDELTGVALSGVFYNGSGLWTVPVEISASGVPTMEDPATNPSVFKQGMNGYECAKIGLYSTSTGELTEILFGGITGNEFVDDPTTGNLVYKPTFPYTNQISAVTIDANGDYSQTYLGDFPSIESPTGEPWLFGSNAEFFPTSELPLLEGEIIDLDSFSETTILGYIYGGIASGAPDGGFGHASIATSQIFKVEYVPVPEPSTAWLIVYGSMVMLAFRQDRVSTIKSAINRDCRSQSRDWR